MTFWSDIILAAICGFGVIVVTIGIWGMVNAAPQPQWQVDEELEEFERRLT